MLTASLDELDWVICLKHVLPAQLKADLRQCSLPNRLGQEKASARRVCYRWGAWTPKLQSMSSLLGGFCLPFFTSLAYTMDAACSSPLVEEDTFVLGVLWGGHCVTGTWRPLASIEGKRL